MEPHKAPTPQRGAASARASDSETANPQAESHSESDQDYGSETANSPSGTWTTTVRAGPKGKRFNNAPNLLVHRHRKTQYSYRTGIRLPKQKLKTWPRYDGKIKDWLKQWSGAFVTFKFPAHRLRSFLLSRQHNILAATSGLPAASSLPSLTPTGLSSFSEADLDPRTPVTAYPSPEGNPTNIQARALQQELLTGTTGSFGLSDQQGLLAPAAATSSGSSIFYSDLGTTFEDLPVSERLIRNSSMGPVRDTSNVHNTIRDVVQNLTEIQIQTHGYLPQTQELLVEKLTDLTQSLAELKRLSSPTESPNNYIHQVAIAPEIVDYVDDGRNPDIFTRDFVEIVQRGNAVINGKQQAFRSFTEIYAQKLKEGIPGVGGQVDRVMRNAGFDVQNESRTNGAAEGDNQATKNGA
ncbi:RNA polymerase II mediator complex subunit [Cladophialophora chaetospira]|uniref:Mediator of RNA polymerase II transcription subunit 10 n=1 Tax=Cladophialophora chaetospira TaxID=386627 RepID=A0AA38X7S3_9EURO|nr:RNA polymerase II mediator complex subunit [Cladophialophora chaetospira]